LKVTEVSPGTQVTDELMHRGGTLASQGGSLRAALDACLSSPTGRGVVVDSAGALVGSITASEVLALIEGRSDQPATGR
jgi:osmoprotectant transport system ATP-binding protein